MLTREEILQLLHEAFTKNQSFTTEHLVFSPDLRLTGKDGSLDSLDTMLFLDNVDELFSERLGYPFDIMGGDAFLREDSPFHSIETLVAYIQELLADQ